MDIQYAQSAVFTPSDFAFPSNELKPEFKYGKYWIDRLI
jgi:hypothetical protein